MTHSNHTQGCAAPCEIMKQHKSVQQKCAGLEAQCGARLLELYRTSNAASRSPLRLSHSAEGSCDYMCTTNSITSPLSPTTDTLCVCVCMH